MPVIETMKLTGCNSQVGTCFSRRFIQTTSSAGFWAALLALALPVAGAQPGSLDLSFDPGTGVDQSVFAAATQTNGHIVIGGDFTRVSGVSRRSIARLNNEGSLDGGFYPGLGANDQVSAVAIKGDKVIIAGYFTSVNATARNSIARLNSDGSVDPSFNPGAGADGPILALAVQSDGKVIVGGQFTSLNGFPRGNIARLNTDGSVDPSFDPGAVGAGVSGEGFSTVNSVALQPDGKVLLGGFFTNFNGMPRRHLARLSSDGNLDVPFFPTVDVTGASLLAGVNSVVVDHSGRILLGGDFTGVNGQARTNIARLNTDGRLDANFAPGTGTDFAVNTIALQTDNKVVIGGFFTHVNGTARNYVARLNTDGGVDTGFDSGSGANDAVYFSAIQEDGKVLIGGLFTSFNGTPRDGIARLEGDTVVPSLRLFDPLRSGNTFQVSVETVLGRDYTLEFKNAVSDDSWTALTTVVGDGTVRFLQDTGATDPHRFYRVRAQ